MADQSQVSYEFSEVIGNMGPAGPQVSYEFSEVIGSMGPAGPQVAYEFVEVIASIATAVVQKPKPQMVIMM